MARVSQPLSMDSFDVLEDRLHSRSSLTTSQGSMPSSPTNSVNFNHKTSELLTVLEEIDVHQSQNARTEVTTPGSLARRLERFHLGDSPVKEFCDSRRLRLQSRGLQKRIPLETDTFLPPGTSDTSQNTERDRHSTSVCEVIPEVPEPKSKVPELKYRVSDNASNSQFDIPKQASSGFDQEQWQKHDAGQFEYVLSVPVSSLAAQRVQQECGTTSDVDSDTSSTSTLTPTSAEASGRLYFGCNLACSTAASPPGNGASYEPVLDPISASRYTLLATPIGHPEDLELVAADKSEEVHEKREMAAMATAAETRDGVAIMLPPYEPHVAYEPQAAYEAHAAYAPHTAYETHAAYEPQAAHEAHAAYAPHTAYETHAAYEPQAAHEAHAAYAPHAVHEPQITVFEPNHGQQTMYSHKDESSVTESMLMRSPAILPHPRIEDSFEAIDQLEEQLEALHEVVRVERVPSPDKALQPVTKQHTSTAGGPKRTSSTVARKGVAAAKASTVRERSKGAAQPARNNSLRKSPSTAFNNGNTKSNSNNKEDLERNSVANVAPTPAAKREVPRPASLLPPKPPAKSSKPATQPTTFELPGEAVARRLKEQREARLARAAESGGGGAGAGAGAGATAASSSATTMAQRSRSARLPTRPTFELPGEAISRRKREEHQAKLRTQEEEERRRREFKAKPIRASLAGPAGGNTYPRETVASRMRQNSKAAAAASLAENHSQQNNYHPRVGATVTGGGGTVVKKRLTLATTSPLRRPLSSTSNASSQQQQQQQQQHLRGRDAEQQQAGNSSAASNRAASSSTTGASASSSGASSTTVVSAEDKQQQRRRGRDIFRRDNSSLTEEREREREAREAMALQARREAAERSRQLGREWAERQQQQQQQQAAAARRALTLLPSAGASVVASAAVL